MDGDNRTIFMTKPWYDPATEAETIWMLEDSLSNGGFNRELAVRLASPPREFWEEFYEGVRGWSGFPQMIEDFTKLERNPALVIYSGEGIAQRVKEILGPTKYLDNIGKGTIRGAFMRMDNLSWRNIAHAPKPDEVAENFRVLEKFKMI
jgi:hypothetical protein